MKNTKNVIELSSVNRNLLIKKIKSNSDVNRLIRGYESLSLREKETLFALLNAFLCVKGCNDIAG